MPTSSATESTTLDQEEIQVDPEALSEALQTEGDLLVRAVQAILLLEPEPLAPRDLARTLEVPEAAAREALEAARMRLADEGIVISSGGGLYRLGTHPEVAPVLEQYFQRSRRRRMSKAMLEVLAIIAVQGPVTRAEVEEIRAVNSDGVIGRCLDHELIEVVGQKETPGRPLQYGVTREFLQYFGFDQLESLRSLLPAEWASLPRQALLDLEQSSAGEGPASDEEE